MLQGKNKYFLGLNGVVVAVSREQALRNSKKVRGQLPESFEFSGSRFGRPENYRVKIYFFLPLKMAKEPLEPGCLYHIYNHAVGNDKLFRSDDNYYYFLKRYQHFIDPVAETYTYCLMPNHIHLFVEIRNVIQLPFDSKYNTSQFVSKQFSNLFSSYSQAYNKQQGRMGNLFISNFKRKLIDNDEYFMRLMRYIHFNPVSHGFSKTISEWRFSGYNSLDSNVETFLVRDKVMAWFGNVEEFRKVHRFSESGGQLPESFELSEVDRGPLLPLHLHLAYQR
jgi:putative transposase